MAGDPRDYLAKLEGKECPATSNDVRPAAVHHPKADVSTKQSQQQPEMSGKSNQEAAIAWRVLRHAGFMVSLLASIIWVGTFALLVSLGDNYSEEAAISEGMDTTLKQWRQMENIFGHIFNAGNAVVQFVVLLVGGLLAGVLALVGMVLSATGLARPPRWLSIAGLLLPAAVLLLTVLWAAWMDSPVPG